MKRRRIRPATAAQRAATCTGCLCSAALTRLQLGRDLFGFNLGYGFGTSVWSDPIDPGGTTGNFNLRGFLTGVTVGANFQTDAFVFGAEADFDGSWIDGKVSGPFCSTGTQCETKNFWCSTLRGRLGYAADRVLFYGTAGGALGDVALGQGGSFQHSLHREPDRENRISLLEARECHLHQPDGMR